MSLICELFRRLILIAIDGERYDISLYCNEEDFHMFDEMLQSCRFLYVRDFEIHYRDPDYVFKTNDTSGVVQINMNCIREYYYELL